MPSITTEGLILRRSNFGEADRVLTVLTDRYGKISVIAKGVRKITSRRAGNIEILNRVKMTLFKGKSYTLNEAESINTFDRIKTNLSLSTTAFHIIELTDKLTPSEQWNPALYNLVVSALKILEQNPRQIFVRSFEVKLLSMMGFYSRDAIRELDPNTKNLLQTLADSSWQQIANMQLTEANALALERFLRYYSEKVLESPLKSVQVMKDLKK